MTENQVSQNAFLEGVKQTAYIEVNTLAMILKRIGMPVLSAGQASIVMRSLMDIQANAVANCIQMQAEGWDFSECGKLTPEIVDEFIRTTGGEQAGTIAEYEKEEAAKISRG